MTYILKVAGRSHGSPCYLVVALSAKRQSRDLGRIDEQETISEDDGLTSPLAFQG